MIELNELKVLAQITDQMELSINNLEKAFNSNNAEDFNFSKSELLGLKEKMSVLIK